MSTTVNRKYPYPNPTGDGADVSYWMQRLAEAVDTDVNGIATTQTFTPLTTSLTPGWSVDGSFEKLTIGKRIQISYSLRMTRSGVTYSYTPSATFGSLGTVIPAEIRTTVWPIYSGVAISGVGANQLAQGVVEPANGNIGFRHTDAFSFPSGGMLSFYGTYYYTGA